MDDRERPSRHYKAALAGDRDAMRALVEALAPIVEARVARSLRRRRGVARGRDVRQDVADLVGEVFVALFENEARVLRTWDEERGLSLANFVGLVAEREVASIMRSGRRCPWTEDPTEIEQIDLAEPAPSPESEVESRDMLEHILDELRIATSPKGYWLFELLFVRDRSVAEVAEETGMSHDALYAWRSRLTKLVRKIAESTKSETAAPPRTTKA